MSDNREASLSLPAIYSRSWVRAFEEARRLGYDYGESHDYATAKTSKPTVINPDASFDFDAHGAPGHRDGISANDLISLHSLFGLLANEPPRDVFTDAYNARVRRYGA